MDDADAEAMQIDILEDILLADDDEDEEFNDNEANQNQNNVGIRIVNPPPDFNLGGGNGNDGELPGVVVAMIGAAGPVGVGGTGGQNPGQGLAQDVDFQVENPTLVILCRFCRGKTKISHFRTSIPTPQVTRALPNCFASSISPITVPPLKVTP